MTNEQAIEIIRKEYKCVDQDCDIERSCGKCELSMPNKGPILQAYKMAIQALSQEPCDDAISREDAEQMFRNIRSHLKPQDYKSAEEFNTRDLMLFNAEQMIHALPSVTQKYGKWIFVDKAHEHAHCSECDYGNIDLLDGRPHNYCPNCGARMESEVQTDVT